MYFFQPNKITNAKRLPNPDDECRDDGRSVIYGSGSLRQRSGVTTSKQLEPKLNIAFEAPGPK
jgi:hypothetical protein